MKNHNPIFIPRNHNVEEALTKACNGDYSSFDLLLNILKTPYSYNNQFSHFLTAPSQEFESHYQTFCGT